MRQGMIYVWIMFYGLLSSACIAESTKTNYDTAPSDQNRYAIQQAKLKGHKYTYKRAIFGSRPSDWSAWYYNNEKGHYHSLSHEDAQKIGLITNGQLNQAAYELGCQIDVRSHIRNPNGFTLDEYMLYKALLVHPKVDEITKKFLTTGGGWCKIKEGRITRSEWTNDWDMVKTPAILNKDGIKIFEQIVYKVRNRFNGIRNSAKTVEDYMINGGAKWNLQSH
jgi:hypothetical protein